MLRRGQHQRQPCVGIAAQILFILLAFISIIYAACTPGSLDSKTGGIRGYFALENNTLRADTKIQWELRDKNNNLIETDILSTGRSDFVLDHLTAYQELRLLAFAQDAQTIYHLATQNFFVPPGKFLDLGELILRSDANNSQPEPTLTSSTSTISTNPFIHVHSITQNLAGELNLHIAWKRTFPTENTSTQEALNTPLPLSGLALLVRREPDVSNPLESQPTELSNLPIPTGFVAEHGSEIWGFRVVNIFRPENSSTPSSQGQTQRIAQGTSPTKLVPSASQEFKYTFTPQLPPQCVRDFAHCEYNKEGRTTLLIVELDQNNRITLESGYFAHQLQVKDEDSPGLAYALSFTDGQNPIRNGILEVNIFFIHPTEDYQSYPIKKVSPDENQLDPKNNVQKIDFRLAFVDPRKIELSEIPSPEEQNSPEKWEIIVPENMSLIVPPAWFLKNETLFDTAQVITHFVGRRAGFYDTNIQLRIREEDINDPNKELLTKPFILFRAFDEWNNAGPVQILPL